MVSKRGTQAASAYHRSGVYSIDCLAPNYQLAYYGRSMDFNTRINTHASSALVKHVREFPGHGFNPREVRLTRDVYQSWC